MIAAVEKGIRAKLAATTAITAVVSTRIYSTQPPLEAPLPYILIFQSAGGSTNDTPRDEFDLVVTVKCVAVDDAVAGTSGAKVAKSTADLIRAALHNATLTLDSPWSAYDCEHETAFSYVDNEDRQQYVHAGGTYRVRATG